MTFSRLVFPVMIALSLPFMAYADIGGVGSPVGVSNAPHPEKQKDAAPDADAQAQPAEARTPLLVIRFNQKRVYFERALGQAIQASEKAKPGTAYDVISYLPAAGRAGEDAGNNLSVVVQQMQGLGVQGERIHVSTQTSGDVQSQEIRIFLN